MIKSIDRDLYEYIAEYILDDTVAVLKALTNEELVVLLNTFYRVNAGSGYSTVLPELAMAKTTKFNRDGTDKYAAKKLMTLKQNPTFTVASRGGAHS